MDMILKLNKPVTFEGETVQEIDLSGLEDTNGATISNAEKYLTKKGVVSPTPQMTIDFIYFMAHRVTGKPIEFFEKLPAPEVMKLKNIVSGFLFGADTEE